jgi:hypothetical protein
MLRRMVLLVLLAGTLSVDAAVPPRLPCCRIWAIEKKSGSVVILRDGTLLRFKAAPSLIRSFAAAEPFDIEGVFAPGSQIKLLRRGFRGANGWVARDTRVDVTLEDFLPPRPCCRIESLHSSTLSLTVRDENSDRAIDAVVTNWPGPRWQGYGLPPAGPHGDAVVATDGRHVFVRVSNPPRTFVLDVLPPVVAPEDRTPDQVSLGTVRAEAPMEVVGNPDESRGRWTAGGQPVFHRKNTEASAIRKLQIEALDLMKAEALVVTRCGVPEAGPRVVVCEGEALGRRRTRK